MAKTSLSAWAFVRQNPFTPPPVCLLYGEETQLLEECRNAVQSRFAAADRHRVDMEKLAESPVAESKGLFGGKSGELFEFVGYGTPSKEALPIVLETANRLQPPDVLLIIFHNLTYKHFKAAWFKQISGVADAVHADRLTAGQASPWIKHWLKENNLNMHDDAVELLAAQSEGNLLAAKQAIRKLSLIAAGDGPITAELVRAALSDGAQYDAFDLTNALLDGKGSRALTVLRQLRADGVAEPFLLWSIGDILSNVAMIHNGESPRVWGAGAGERMKKLRALARRLDEKHLYNLLRQSAFTDRVIKGVAGGDMETALMRLSINLAAIQRGVKIRHPEYLP